MINYIQSTLPYKLGEEFPSLKDTLKYIGTYYYERFEVFGIKDKLVDKLYNHLIDKIELFKFDNLLIGIIIYLKADISYYNSVKLNMDDELQVKGVLVSTYKGLINSWNNDKEKIGLIHKDNKLVINYSLREYEI